MEVDEPIIQSEVRKRKNNICRYIESRKMVLMKLFVGQQWRHRYREQTYGQDSGEAERKERVGWNETVIWKHTLLYIK